MRCHRVKSSSKLIRLNSGDSPQYESAQRASTGLRARVCEHSPPHEQRQSQRRSWTERKGFVRAYVGAAVGLNVPPPSAAASTPVPIVPPNGVLPPGAVVVPKHS